VKEMMAPQWRHISPKLMEALPMMKYSIQKGSPLNFTQGMWWKDELIEFEFAARMEPVGDAEAYGHSLKDDDDEGADDMEDDMDELEKDLEALEEHLFDDESRNGDDNDSADDIYK
jgi:hypothetical protein